MKKLSFLIAQTLAVFSLCAAELKVGVVNFNECITKSKYGKQEQASFEMMRNQYMRLLEDTEKQIKEISDKLQDPNQLEALSSEGETELRNKLAALSEDMARYQQQAYQAFQQAQYQLMASMHEKIQTAAKESSGNYDVVLNKEVCFVCKENTDITNKVIDQMDKNFDKANKALPAIPNNPKLELPEQK